MSRILAAAAVSAMDVAGAGLTGLDRKRCKSKTYGSSSEIMRLSAELFLPALAALPANRTDIELMMQLSNTVMRIA